MISSPRTWATQVEVVAAASVFQVPLYYCTQDKNVYKWNVVQPFLNRECPLKLPAFPQSNDSTTLLMPTHFELFYYDNCHIMMLLCPPQLAKSARPLPHSPLLIVTYLI